jgi:regulator of RNase E activity RraB
MPDLEQIKRQMQFDLSTKKAMRKHGDDETKTHVVEHHFVADGEADLTALANIGRLLGFEPGKLNEHADRPGAAYWTFDLLSRTATPLNTLSRESILMLALAEAYGVKYDGWGTLIEK